MGNICSNVVSFDPDPCLLLGCEMCEKKLIKIFGVFEEVVTLEPTHKNVPRFDPALSYTYIAE